MSSRSKSAACMDGSIAGLVLRKLVSRGRHELSRVRSKRWLSSHACEPSEAGSLEKITYSQFYSASAFVCARAAARVSHAFSMPNLASKACGMLTRRWSGQWWVVLEFFNFKTRQFHPNKSHTLSMVKVHHLATNHVEPLYCPWCTRKKGYRGRPVVIRCSFEHW
jgi:hypothetical protein